MCIRDSAYTIFQMVEFLECLISYPKNTDAKIVKFELEAQGYTCNAVSYTHRKMLFLVLIILKY